MEHARTNRCRLCGNETTRRNSHIIPDFAVKFVKSIGLLPSVLTAESGGTPVQQAFRKYLLGDCCEQLFSGWERPFAKHIFHPCVSTSEVSRAHFSTEWFQKASISFAWRAAEDALDRKADFVPVDRRLLIDAMSSWEQYLLHGDMPFSKPQWAFFGIEDVEPSDTSAVWEIMEYPHWYLTYLTSVCDYGLAFDSGFYGAYVKLPCMIMWANIIPDRIIGRPPAGFLTKQAKERSRAIKSQIDQNIDPVKQLRQRQQILKRNSGDELRRCAQTQFGQAWCADFARTEFLQKQEG